MNLYLIITLLGIFTTLVARSQNISGLRSQLQEEIESHDDDDDDDDGGGDVSYGISDSVVSTPVPNGSSVRISCVTCEPPDCSFEGVCHGALKCYTSYLRDSDGVEHKSKGID
jgi:hypothetical protein